MISKPFIKTGNAFTAICDQITAGLSELITLTRRIHVLMVVIVIIVMYYSMQVKSQYWQLVDPDT